jgi:hypothetical protein
MFYIKIYFNKQDTVSQKNKQDTVILAELIKEDKLEVISYMQKFKISF